jgi:glycosyltransferase involved in cell wall biosynthesis
VTTAESHRVLVAIPSLNEAATVAQVVESFRRTLPDARIVVYDNGSTDDTVGRARAAGAEVQAVEKRGKGNVVQAILARADVDAIVLVDGDDTYDAADAPALLGSVLRNETDMAVGNRLDGAPPESIRRLHRFGNRLIVGMVNRMFGTRFTDVLSGYRVVGRSVVDRVTPLTSGFEIETELTVRTLAEGLRISELPVSYRPRPAGSDSKLQAFQDGYRIILTAVLLLRDLFPLRFFGLASAAFATIAVITGVLRVLGYLGVDTLPESLLSGLFSLASVLALLAFGFGLTLNTINTRMRELAAAVRRSQDGGT